MKFFIVSALLVTLVHANPTFVPSEEPATRAPEVAPVAVDEVRVEPHSDPSLVLSEPIDNATKLLISLDEHVQKYLPADKVSGHAPEEVVPAATTVTPQIYGSDDLDISAMGKQDSSVSSLLDQLDILANRIQETINQLVQRRRYVLSAMLRPMVTYVRRVRSNLERLQNRLTAISAAAAAPADPSSGPAPPPPPGVDSSVIDNIRRRIEEIQRQIGNIINRISASLSPFPAGAQGSPAGGR